MITTWVNLQTIDDKVHQLAIKLTTVIKIPYKIVSSKDCFNFKAGIVNTMNKSCKTCTAKMKNIAVQDK
jgi:hypothetical protein